MYLPSTAILCAFSFVLIYDDNWKIRSLWPLLPKCTSGQSEVVVGEPVSGPDKIVVLLTSLSDVEMIFSDMCGNNGTGGGGGGDVGTRRAASLHLQVTELDLN